MNKTDHIFLNTKASIYEKAVSVKNSLEKNARTDVLRSAAYYHTVSSLFDRFLNHLDQSILFKKLEDCWGYDLSYSYDGISLNLTHYHSDGDSYKPDQTYRLFQEPARYLTAEEYASLYGVGAGTVRQWIRRAKIRSAKKYGNEWRISELSDPPQRGYTDASYYLGDLTGSVPVKFHYLKDYDFISIHQSADRSCYQVTLLKRTAPYSKKEFELSREARESLELFLIGNPEIRYIQQLQEHLLFRLLNNP